VKRAFGDAFVKLTSVVYLMLGVSVLTTAATVPVWMVALGTDLALTWPALVITAPLFGPAAYAAFACFDDHLEGGLKVVSVYARAWRAGLRPGGTLGVAATLLGTVLVTDAVALAGSKSFALALPALATTGAVGLVTFFTCVGAAREFPAVKLRHLAKASLFCSVRGMGWSLVTLCAWALWGWFLTRNAVLALAVALGPILYLVWANSGHSLGPLRGSLNARPPAASGHPRSTLIRVASATRPAEEL
jgi:hypothetical protein